MLMDDSKEEKDKMSTPGEAAVSRVFDADRSFPERAFRGRNRVVRFFLSEVESVSYFAYTLVLLYR